MSCEYRVRASRALLTSPLLCLAGAVLISGCTDLKKAIGLERSAPDEFAVESRAPPRNCLPAGDQSHRCGAVPTVKSRLFGQTPPRIRKPSNAASHLQPSRPIPARRGSVGTVRHPQFEISLCHDRRTDQSP